MRDTSKKLLTIAAATLLGSAFVFSGCGASGYLGDDITGTFTSNANASVSSNGGFAVERDGYIYFINGAESYTASNAYGDAVRGSLMRISSADLAAGNYQNVKTIVPQLFVEQKLETGIYIYGDYVYYATPTTDKSVNDNTVQNTELDFKRAKLDGSEAPMSGYYFRLKTNNVDYRFVQAGANNTVYCLYEDGTDLKSFNTETWETVTLVKGASDYLYDTQDLTNPNVYYTMSVSQAIDTPNATAESYKQLYKVNAADKVTAIDAAEAKYTFTNGEYDFDKASMQLKDEKDDSISYNYNDYTTYPYVNLGKLVLDGVGKTNEKTYFNAGDISKALTSCGYTYTVKSYQNGGLYFTRNTVVNPSGTTPLYYLADADLNGLDSIEGNKTVEESGKIVTVAQDSTQTDSAIIYKKGDVQQYFYTDASGYLYRAQYDAQSKTTAKVLMSNQPVGSVTLWRVQEVEKTVGTTPVTELYLYYYVSGSEGYNGNNLTRVRADGSQTDYNDVAFGGELASALEYAPITLCLVDWNSAWYKPEIFGDTLLFSNAQAVGDTSYNYVYATKLGDRADLQAIADRYADTKAYAQKDEYKNDSELSSLFTYYYTVGDKTAYEAVESLYSTEQKTAFDTFVEKFVGVDANTPAELIKQNEIIVMLGKQSGEHAEAIAEYWKGQLKQEETADNTQTLETWAVVLIIVGSVLVVAAGVTVPLVIVAQKKKAKKQAEEATVNAYKRQKIDTTDDKSIDVYADDEQAAEAQEQQSESEESGENE